MCLGETSRYVWLRGIPFKPRTMEQVNDRLGYWKVSGRGDRVIVTGGEKVDPEFCGEEPSLDTGLVEQCLVMGIKDEQLGAKGDGIPVTPSDARI